MKTLLVAIRSLLVLALVALAFGTNAGAAADTRATGSISGTFTGSDAVDGVAVYSGTRQTGYIRQGFDQVDGSGDYLVGDLTPGTYYVAFVTGVDLGEPLGWTPSLNPFGVIPNVEVTDGGTAEVDFTKGTVQSISGTVTYVDGWPIEGIKVCVREVGPAAVPITDEPCGATFSHTVATTDENGHYTVPNLAPTAWEVSVGGTPAGDVGVGVVADASPVWLAPDQPSTGVDAALGPAFQDVPSTHPFAGDINWMAGHGITGGFAGGNFRPTGAVARMAMAAFLYRYADSPEGENPPCATAPFTDVATSHPFCGEIEWMTDQGIAGGYPDGTFRPAALISRQAMSAFLYRLAGSPAGEDPECLGTGEPVTIDVPASHPFCGEIAWMLESGITTGYPDGTFRPGANVTRQSMAAFIHRFDQIAE